MVLTPVTHVDPIVGESSRKGVPFGVADVQVLPEEFRRGTVRLVLSSDKSVARWLREFGSTNDEDRRLGPSDRYHEERDRKPGAISENERTELQRLRRSGRAQDRARDPTQGRPPILQGDDAVSRFRFVSELAPDRRGQAAVPSAPKVSRSGSGTWCRRSPSERAKRDAELSALISDIHQNSRTTYGAPRVSTPSWSPRPAFAKKRVARLWPKRVWLALHVRRRWRTGSLDVAPVWTS